MGLPTFDEEAVSSTEKFIADISGKGGNELWHKNYLPGILYFLSWDR